MGWFENIVLVLLGVFENIVLNLFVEIGYNYLLGGFEDILLPGLRILYWFC